MSARATRRESWPSSSARRMSRSTSCRPWSFSSMEPLDGRTDRSSAWMATREPHHRLTLTKALAPSLPRWRRRANGRRPTPISRQRSTRRCTYGLGPSSGVYARVTADAERYEVVSGLCLRLLRPVESGGGLSIYVSARTRKGPPEHVDNATSGRVEGSLGTDALSAYDSIPGRGRRRSRMALEPSPTGCVPHEAELSVDQRTKQIIERGEGGIAERRESRDRDELAERQEANDGASPEQPRERGRRLRTRAHRTSMGITEGALGAPRSGSA